MKKSANVTLGLVATMALAFTAGCSRRTAERRDCVDEQSRITNEQNCINAEQRRTSGYAGYFPYHYMYGGSSGGRIGDTVFNGNPSPGMRSGGGIGSWFGGSHSGSVSRGGFGSSMSGGS